MKDDLGVSARWRHGGEPGLGAVEIGRACRRADPPDLCLADDHDGTVGMSRTVGAHRPQQQLVKAAVAS